VCDDVAAARGDGWQVVLVASGAVAAGMPALNLPRRPSDIGVLQAVAAVGQPRLVARFGAHLERHGVVTRIAVQLGLGSETLRHWVKQAEIDNGQRPGVTTKDQQRIAELEKEVRELRRANQILKAASAFFARELDPRLPK